MEYALHLAILVAIYTTVATSLDLLVGEIGLLSVAQAAFFGVGAYVSAIVSTRYQVPFLGGALLGVLSAAALSLAASIPALRLRADYFAVMTFALQIIAFSIFNNWLGWTGGPIGIAAIPSPMIFAWKLDSRISYLILSGMVATGSLLVVAAISTSAFGRVLHAIREDELFAQALGKNIAKFKVTTFAISASLAALAGSVYAHYIAFIDPTTFTVMDSVLALSMVVMGGMGSRLGSLLGATVVTVLPELLRFLALGASVEANLHLVIYGALLVILMMFRPQGMVGRYGFGR